jgi:hypothetical protein
VALIVEDGAGVPGANAYINPAYADEYFTGERLSEWEALKPEEREAAVIGATAYVDIAFEWYGNRGALEQNLGWPRSGVSFEGFPVKGVPPQVRKATAEAAWLVLEGEELFPTDGGAEIAAEQVDVIKVTYREPARRAASRFEVLNKLLRGLYKTDTGGASGSVTGVKVRRV